MRILVCSKLSIPDKDRHLPCWEYARSLGHEITVEHPRDCHEKPDFIIVMGVSIQDEAFAAMDKFPDVPVGVYNWDCYEWVWNNPRPGEYNYVKFGQLCHDASVVWTPSDCTSRRTTQWWDIPPEKITRILSACPWWDSEDTEDEGYAMCALREIPDKRWGLLEQACSELEMPIRMTRHEVDREEYEHAVSHCSFMVAPLYELSTGGLSLMEAYRLGKPCLISDSEWNGGRDYMGDRASYFKDGDIDDLKRALQEMMSVTRFHPMPDDHKEWIETNYSDERMVDDVLESIAKHA